GYAAYIDVQSWVDMHVIQELTKEVDSYVFSTFYHKDKNGKVVCGPLWDFDRAFGNVDSAGVDDPEGWRGGPGGGRGPFWDRLFEDPDFTQHFIDRWQELMGGTLAEANLHAIIDQMAAEVDEAQDRNFEPAGPWPLADVTRSHLTFPTYDQHVTYLKDWISDRLGWVQAQFTAKPQFNQAPGSHGAPFNLGLSSQGGTIFYTTDGSDPRSPGGGVAGTAYSGAIPISQTTSVIARVRDGMDWSGPIIGHFILGEPASSANLVVSEIMYHPAGASASEVAAGFADEESFEFIEFTNIGANPVELSGVTVSEAFDFSFPVFEIAPGGRVLLVRDRAAFDFRYGQVGSVLGEYGDSKLSNGGEQIVIWAADGQVIRDFAFDDSSPWPEAADGDGFSLVLIDPMSVPAHGDPSNWRASGFAGGSPAGTDTTRFVGDPGADGNRNGLSDLIEYAIGDTLASGFSDSGFITFRQNLLADDVLVSVEVSDDLATWQSGPDAVVRSRMDHHGDGTATVVWESVAPTARSQFMRVRVTTR
ncbi:MAG: CotH kinase family protein, partial [Verrucomicrobiales bacterium]